MEETRWQRLVTVFDAVLNLEPDLRGRYLDDACAGEPSLRAEIDDLLNSQTEADQWFEQPALDTMARRIAETGSAELGEFPAGKILLHYKLLERVGAGGMGVVYRACDTRLNRQVAIKVLPRILVEDKQSLLRFKREALMMAALNHPRMAGIYGLEETDAEHFIAIEWVEGETLDQILHQRALGLDEALRICLDVAEGLAAAHEQGIIHRDLKPENIKITPQGRAKILDFGLAKPIRDKPTATNSIDPALLVSLNQPGFALGTPAYMSPEEFMGQKADAGTDIWGFGCVMYTCLTGRRPFRGHTRHEVLAAILRLEPDWTLLPADTPPAIRSLMQSCLHKSLKHRLHRIAEACEVISAAFTAPAPKEQPEEKGYVILRRPILIMLSLAVLALIVTMAVLLALHLGS